MKGEDLELNLRWGRSPNSNEAAEQQRLWSEEGSHPCRLTEACKIEIELESVIIKTLKQLEERLNQKKIWINRDKCPVRSNLGF